MGFSWFYVFVDQQSQEPATSSTCSAWFRRGAQRVPIPTLPLTGLQDPAEGTGFPESRMPLTLTFISISMLKCENLGVLGLISCHP